MVQMIAVRVTTARKLIHEKLESRSNRNEAPTEAEERGPHRSREQVRILKEVGTLQVELISMGNPGHASAAAMQRLAEFGIYHDLQIHCRRHITSPSAHSERLC